MSDPQQVYPPVAPYLMVRDGDRALAWYQAALGATVSERYDHGGKLGHATLRLPNRGCVFLSDEFPEMADRTGTQSPAALGGTTCTVALEVPNADAAHVRALEAGAQELRPPADEFYGRMSKVRDPFGHVWSFSGPTRTEPAQG